VLPPDPANTRGTLSRIADFASLAGYPSVATCRSLRAISLPFISAEKPPVQPAPIDGAGRRGRGRLRVTRRCTAPTARCADAPALPDADWGEPSVAGDRAPRGIATLASHGTSEGVGCLGIASAF
jgi:hypothetical protein